MIIAVKDQLMQLPKDILKKIQSCRDSNPDVRNILGKDEDEMLCKWVS